VSDGFRRFGRRSANAPHASVPFLPPTGAF